MTATMTPNERSLNLKFHLQEKGLTSHEQKNMKKDHKPPPGQLEAHCTDLLVLLFVLDIMDR